MIPAFLCVLSLPFLGTVSGAACVFFMKRQQHPGIQLILAGFAGGVMMAASVWSLLIPAMEYVSHLGKLAFLPAIAGIWGGYLFLSLADRLIPKATEGSGMLFLAVTLHNLPEGMAVGAAVAGWLTGIGGLSASAAIALAAGIGLQNIPEGAIISMPLSQDKASRTRAFGWGVVSGIVEPVGAIGTILLSHLMVPVLPFMLSFSAGAMLYVITEELLCGSPSKVRTYAFAAGFTVMLILDVALG